MNNRHGVEAGRHVDRLLARVVVAVGVDEEEGACLPYDGLAASRGDDAVDLSVLNRRRVVRDVGEELVLDASGLLTADVNGKGEQTGDKCDHDIRGEQSWIGQHGEPGCAQQARLSLSL